MNKTRVLAVVIVCIFFQKISAVHHGFSYRLFSVSEEKYVTAGRNSYKQVKGIHTGKLYLKENNGRGSQIWDMISVRGDEPVFWSYPHENGLNELTTLPGNFDYPQNNPVQLIEKEGNIYIIKSTTLKKCLTSQKANNFLSYEKCNEDDISQQWIFQQV